MNATSPAVPAPPIPETSPSPMMLARPETLRGAELRDTRAAYLAYLAGGAAGFDAYDYARDVIGLGPGMALAWARQRLADRRAA